MSSRDEAQRILERGRVPIPIPFQSKAPVFEGWEALTLKTADVANRFNGVPQNFGVLLGAPSGWLVDEDLDCAEAIAVAPLLMPATETFGRQSARSSHRLYVSVNAETKKFYDPVMVARGERKKAMLVELRSTGCQTVFPPSVHESGEPIGYDDGALAEPATIDAQSLARLTAQVAAAALLMRYGGLDAQTAADAIQDWEAGLDDGLPDLAAKAVRSWLGIASTELDHAPARTTGPRPPQSSAVDRLEERAHRYIARMPHAVSGNYGHFDAYKVALVLVRGFNLRDSSTTFDLMRDYSARCDPPWSEREIAHKVQSAMTSAKAPPFGYLLEDDRGWPRAAAPPTAAPADAETPPATITVPIADFLGDEADADVPDEWLTDKMIPAGVVAFLAGLPKSKKTWVAILVAICVATGRALFDKFPCKQGSVLVVTEEDTVKQVRQRLWWLARGLGVDPRTLPMRVSAMKGFRIDDDAHFAQLEQEAQGAALVVLDALTRIHGADENDRTAMQTVTHALSQIAARTGATVLVIHHMRKRHPLAGDQERAGQRMRGTGDLHALARAVLAAEKRDDGATKICAESNYGEDVEPFAVALSIEPPVGAQLGPGEKRRASFKFLGSDAEVTERGVDDEVLKALEAQTEPQTKNEVVKLVRGNAEEVRAAIKRLANRNPPAIELVIFDHREGNRTVEREGWRLVGRGA